MLRGPHEGIENYKSTARKRDVQSFETNSERFFNGNRYHMYIQLNKRSVTRRTKDETEVGT